MGRSWSAVGGVLASTLASTLTRGAIRLSLCNQNGPERRSSLCNQYGPEARSDRACAVRMGAEEAIRPSLWNQNGPER